MSASSVPLSKALDPSVRRHSGREHRRWAWMSLARGPPAMRMRESAFVTAMSIGTNRSVEVRPDPGVGGQAPLWGTLGKWQPHSHEGQAAHSPAPLPMTPGSFPIEAIWARDDGRSQNMPDSIASRQALTSLRMQLNAGPRQPSPGGRAEGRSPPLGLLVRTSMVSQKGLRESLWGGRAQHQRP